MAERPNSREPQNDSVHSRTVIAALFDWGLVSAGDAVALVGVVGVVGVVDVLAALAALDASRMLLAFTGPEPLAFWYADPVGPSCATETDLHPLANMSGYAFM